MFLIFLTEIKMKLDDIIFLIVINISVDFLVYKEWVICLRGKRYHSS